MSNYPQWLKRVDKLSPTLDGLPVASANEIKVITHDGRQFLLKTILPERPYVSRIKILGEVAYSFFDYHLNPLGRISPFVKVVSIDTLWREFLPGLPGEMWRGELYAEKQDLDLADVFIRRKILMSKTARRIALLDLIFMCQDRSARNWIEHDGEFYAIDNAMLWSYRGRFADKETVKTGSVAHLRNPMYSVIMPGTTEFRNGIFSTLYAGRGIAGDLLDAMRNLDWPKYFGDLRDAISCIYPKKIVSDWRFQLLKGRVAWLIDHGRFPTVKEAHSLEWNLLVGAKPVGSKCVWKLKWEAK